MTLLRLLETMLALSLQVTLIVAATACMARRFCRTEGSRDTLWTSCLVAILLLPLADLGLPHLRLLPPPATTIDPQTGLAIERLASCGVWLIALWIAGAAFTLGRQALGFARGVRLLRQTALISPEKLPEPWGRLSATVSSMTFSEEGSTIRFLSTKELVSPYCWQLHRPMIVLPEFVLSFPADELTAVIRHELAHVRFRHPLWLFVQRLVEIIFWFHPAARWTARQASRTREFVCDAAAATAPEDAAALLRALLRLTNVSRGGSRSNLASLATGETAGVLSERAKKLGSGNQGAPPRDRRSIRGLFPLAMAGAAMLLAWLPIDVAASRRSAWSPWPKWSAHALQSVGIAARDYEVDAHRLRPHRHDQ
ncbi:MAG TPA: M56 family metallopeptidase [Pirellulales bacterium]